MRAIDYKTGLYGIVYDVQAKLDRGEDLALINDFLIMRSIRLKHRIALCKKYNGRVV